MAPLINFSGIASGIDSSALIKALLDQQRSTRVTPLQTRIDRLTSVDSSFDELSGLLGTLQTSAGKFRALNGGSIVKTATSSNETVVGASAINGAASGSYEISVQQLARNGTISFNDRFSATSSAVAASLNDADSESNRTVTFTVGSGADQETVGVVLTSTSTLEDVVTSFNSQSSKAEASVVNVGTSSSPSYALVIASANAGSELGQVAASVGSAISSAGALSGTTVSQAQDAQFTVSGINGTVTRSSNQVNDVISGVTLNLNSLGSATINISNDAASTTENLQDFVDAYNEVVQYIGKNNTITREEDGSEVTNVFGPLADTTLDDNVLSALRQALTDSSKSGGAVNSLADLGITSNRDGTLKLDSDTLKNALATDPDGVASITETLGETLSAVDGSIAQFTRFDGLFDVTKQANSDEIHSLNNRISDVETSLSKQEAELTQRYSRLESLIGKLNSQQSTLSALLPR